jgi:ribonucleoside-diphosphate reductase alpha chain
MSCRSLSNAQIKSTNVDDEFYLGVDVARSQNTNNNQSSVSVAKVIRSKDTQKIVSIDIVNIINIPNILNFTAQACKIKQIQKIYSAKAVVVDGNGLGAGLIDELLKESFDPISKESLGCFDTINTDNTPELQDANKIVYDLKAQSVQNKVVTNFIDMVDSGKLRLLCQRQFSDFTEKENEDFENKILPYIQTDAFFEETANLKMKHLPNGGVTVEKVVKKLDKDRVSACMYVLWYINEFCREINNSDYDFDFEIDE